MPWAEGEVWEDGPLTTCKSSSLELCSFSIQFCMPPAPSRCFDHAPLPSALSSLQGPGNHMIQFCMASLLATMVLDDPVMVRAMYFC